ncbi:MAG: hypothetical protein EOS63_32620 [Mesorhizobium sp.]|nr:MAG: hypothetical protein EOS63_32620 [Mesorhizobium sp.]TIT07063.1 MAG: hypothetical protein E5W74_27600 [Mesorhizobium sp.]TJW58127.1 MAG: hypothetical protein E5V97_33935 [Mesorhizobium sp.]
MLVVLVCQPVQCSPVPGSVSKTFLGVSAAPHLPAGILSPYSDGERDAVAGDFANHQRSRKSASVAASVQRIDG